MDETFQMLDALTALEFELPGLVDEAAWPAFEAELSRLMAEARQEPDRILEVGDQLRHLLARYPEVQQRVAEMMVQLREQTFESMLPPPAAERSAGEGPGAARMMVRYTDISCPRRVWVETPRISVVVRLTLTPRAESAAVEPLSVRDDVPVQVRVDAPQFEPLNEPLQELVVLPDRDSAPLVFDLRPRRVGHTTLSFDFFQNGQPLRTVSVPVEITAASVPEGSEFVAAQPVRAEPDAVPPDLVLRIAWDPADAQLTFELIREGGAWWRSFSPVRINGDPAAHAAQLYARITTIMAADGRHLGARPELPRDDVDRQIRKLGQALWEEAVPPDLKSLYAQERDQWRNQSMLIFSDDPYLPWELLWPYDVEAGAWEDEGPWCQSLHLARWLRKDDRGNGNEMAPAQLAMRNLAILAPMYTQLNNLPFAQQERQTLLALAQRYQLQNVGPGDSTWRSVIDFLENGGYDWLHFAAHGSFRPDTPDGDSALWLQEDRALEPQHLTGAAIRRYFVQHRPALFFNACEVGRQGWALSRIGGWANRLVSAGAGLFVAPQWAVQDNSAAAFSQAFYRALLDGETVAAAARQARLAAQSPGDPTWLAYSVYGHPNARVAV